MDEKSERGRALIREMRSIFFSLFFDAEELDITPLGRLLVLFVLVIDCDTARFWLAIAVN